ncbi:hypothetical protein BXZ70DRAFT_891770 [Cristinia sonorae]|uniref:Uncharacterized protein n=1 Tax=Cristinia sonorae TaxID=1940300 RepID=A0A8K0XQS2_9AGAR|nr:hypothetical protein BXZ70DRAFT_891770 [Cristinia sonorae]
MRTLQAYDAVTSSSDSITIDRATIVGFDFAYAAYGVHATLFFLCLSQLLAQRKARPRRSYALIAYISLLFILGSLANGIDMRMGQSIFVDNRDYPGGPGAYAPTTFTVPINVICTAACVIGAWLQDALMLYRFYIILSPAWYVMAVPTGLFIVSIVMSCLLLAQLTHPNSTIWQRANVNIELAYWSTTIATNILLTILIVTYLIRQRRRVINLAGHDSMSARTPYLSASAMLVEAAFLYTVFGLAFLIPYALGNPLNILFFSLLGQVQFITPLLIILRVVQGRSFAGRPTDTIHSVSSTSTSTPSTEWSNTDRYLAKAAGSYTQTPREMRSSGDIVFKSPMVIVAQESHGCAAAGCWREKV